MQKVRGGLAALIASGVAIAALQVLPWPPATRGDFAPFLMTITEWDTNRVGLSDGRILAGTSVYQLDYHDHENWSYTLVSDDVPGYGVVQIPGQGSACRNGAYGHVDPLGSFTVTDRAPTACNGVGRWIAYGIAWSYHWDKTISDGVVTYTNYGERVSFDLKTGLPTTYEAGLSPGAIGHHLTTYHLKQP